MSNFNNLFDQWAPVYDETVNSSKGEYSEVFSNYYGILEEICNIVSHKANGNILEIGVGTGNLTEYLKARGLRIVGVEPSLEMRKIASAKLKDIEIFEGSFLDIPIHDTYDGIVSSYALHHLTYKEKQMAIKYLDNFLAEGGKIVIADTMFESIEYKEQLLRSVEADGATNLLKDLNTEYYEMLEDIVKLFEDLNYSITAEKLNRYVWIVTATKGNRQ